MKEIVFWVSAASSVLGLLVSLVTLYQLRLFIGRELRKGIEHIL